MKSRRKMPFKMEAFSLLKTRLSDWKLRTWWDHYHSVLRIIWFAANLNSLRIKIFAFLRITCDSHDSHICESCESYDSQWFAFSRILRIIWFAWFAFLRILRIIWFAWFAFLRIMRIAWFAWFAFLRIMRIIWFALANHANHANYMRIMCDSHMIR